MKKMRAVYIGFENHGWRRNCQNERSDPRNSKQDKDGKRCNLGKLDMNWTKWRQSVEFSKRKRVGLLIE
jgi:hypothetical protein